MALSLPRMHTHPSSDPRRSRRKPQKNEIWNKEGSMLEQHMLLRTTSISEVVMSQMDQQYVSRVTWYLEHDLGCRVTYRGRQGGYHIQLPEGTVEAIYAGQS